MSKNKTYIRDELLFNAMQQFWRFGYYATSMNDLVQVTGVSRHGIYTEFESKRNLFIAALELYSEEVVTPAFRQVESPNAGLKSIQAYFNQQIALAVDHGLPGPGCLVANTMVESGPHDKLFNKRIQKHIKRLHSGFYNALRNEASHNKSTTIDKSAHFLTISAQSLWSISRTVTEPAVLYDFMGYLLNSVEMRLAL